MSIPIGGAGHSFHSDIRGKNDSHREPDSREPEAPDSRELDRAAPPPSGLLPLPPLVLLLKLPVAVEPRCCALTSAAVAWPE